MSKKYDIPKKKHHKGLIIFLIIFGILVVLPVGFVFGAFFTTKSKEVSNTTIHYQNIVSESLHRGIKELKDEEGKRQLDFTIDEEMIDGIMMAACEKIGQEKYIPKMYCYINENDYTFYADLQASFFKTRVAIATHLSTEGEGDTKQLVFKINNITVGRLPIPINWVTGILGNFLNDDTLNTAFEKSGFRITSDLKNAQLIYKRETFKEDVGNYLSDLGNNNPFLNVLLSVFGDEKILTTNFKDGVTASFNLEPLQIVKGDEYYKEAPLKFTKLDKYKEDITNWLNYDKLEEKDVSSVYTYLLRGYDKSPSSIKKFIDTLKDTELGKALQDDVNVNSLDQYNGSECWGDKVFEDYCKDTLEQDEVFNLDIANSCATFKLSSDGTEDNPGGLNAVLASKLDNIIGNTTPITFKEGDLWYCDYVTVDNVYTGFKKATSVDKTEFILYFRVNISGVPVTVAVVTNNIGMEGANPETGYFGHLKFEIKNVYFGELEIKDEELIKAILKLIPVDGETTFKYNEKEKQFEVDIEKLANFGTELPIEIKKAIATAIKNADPELGFDDDSQTLTFKYEYDIPIF